MKKYSLIKKGSYHPTSRIKRAVLYCIAAICLLLLASVVPRVMSAVVATLWYPIDSVRVWIHTAESALPVYLRDRMELSEELTTLRQQVATQGASPATMDRLQKENQELRELLGAVPGERQLVRVIARPNTLPYDMLLIDKGSVHGIVNQAPVYLGQDQVIGYISAVRTNTALVTLVTSPDFSATAYVIGPDIFTVTEGMGGGVMRVQVPQGINLQVDDTVVLPAIDSGVYGRIFAVETSPTQPEKFGYVSPPVALQSLRYVSVGSDPVVTNSYVAAVEMAEGLADDLFQVDLPDGVLVTPQLAATSTVSTATSTTEGELE